MKVKVGAQRAESDLTKIYIKKRGIGEEKAENWERAEQLREKIDFEKWERASDGSELHRESKDKDKKKKKIQNWQEKLRLFPESSSARRTHPASLSALPQPFNWFNSPKWSLSVCLGSFFPSAVTFETLPSASSTVNLFNGSTLKKKTLIQRMSNAQQARQNLIKTPMQLTTVI